MSEIINLRQARKRRDRNQKHRESAVKRVKFGADKNEKAVISFIHDRQNRHLDDHKREEADRDFDDTDNQDT